MRDFLRIFDQQNLAANILIIWKFAPRPRDVLRVLRPDAAALCSANGCYRLLPAHFDSPALRPFPHPFSRRSRHRQRIIQREDQTSRPDRRGYSSLLLGASRVIPSRTCRVRLGKGCFFTEQNAAFCIAHDLFCVFAQIQVSGIIRESSQFFRLFLVRQRACVLDSGGNVV